MNIRTCHPKNISLTTLLKLQVDTISPEYVEQLFRSVVCVLVT